MGQSGEGLGVLELLEALQGPRAQRHTPRGPLGTHRCGPTSLDQLVHGPLSVGCLFAISVFLEGEGHCFFWVTSNAWGLERRVLPSEVPQREDGPRLGVNVRVGRHSGQAGGLGQGVGEAYCFLGMFAWPQSQRVCDCVPGAPAECSPPELMEPSWPSEVRLEQGLGPGSVEAAWTLAGPSMAAPTHPFPALGSVAAPARSPLLHSSEPRGLDPGACGHGVNPGSAASLLCPWQGIPLGIIRMKRALLNSSVECTSLPLPASWPLLPSPALAPDPHSGPVPSLWDFRECLSVAPTPC